MVDARSAKRKQNTAFGRAKRDIVALGIAVAAIFMFLGTGITVLPDIARSWTGIGSGPDQMLVTALLLNIALVIFGWRRYRELTAEIIERKYAEEQARMLAETDPLTGCLNRRSIVPATQELLDDARGNSRNVAFFAIDLDNFKQINDMNGHKTGDDALKLVAARMAALLPKGGTMARLGGDEFGCVISYAAHMPERIDQIAAMLIEKIAESVILNGMRIEITMSLGIATSAGEPASTPSPATLMHQADIAMYHAKRQGKNRYSWFEAMMENELRFRNDLEVGIRNGLQNGEFVPYYEQQIDLESGDLVGFEMLARWNSPDLGVVSPDIFIPVAEEMGVITELSDQLLAQALEDAKGWDARLTMSVNISPVQLRDPWFSQKLLQTLTRHNFPAKRLDVEITESCLHDNLGVVRSMLVSLRNQGVQVSLDDFGTGYSSFAQLRSLPFDRLKIDRSFISELRDDGSNSKIVSAIVSLADGLNLPITAEGIEDTKILETLKKLGRLKGQGFLYGKPQNAEATRVKLAEAGLLADWNGSASSLAGSADTGTVQSGLGNTATDERHSG